MADKVAIVCGVPNGLALQLQEPGYDDGTGRKPSVGVGPVVNVAGPRSARGGTGAPGGGEAATTEVDAEFWAKWLEQNAGHPAVTSGLLREAE